jgi:hypothetical protein
MAEQALDFWPEIETNIRTPVTILKQQASLLGKHTSNLLEARVVSQPWGDGFIHRFLIELPTIDYTFELFRVSHDVNLYPVRIDSGRYGDVALKEPLPSEEAFVNWLKAVLNSAETKRILSTLLAQAES